MSVFQLLRRRSQRTTRCFYCHSAVAPVASRAFQCNACGSLNLFDDAGNIISADPAMYDETLNTQSFAKRASHTKNRLPTSYRKSVFCHACQTNQTLIANLLSNYLPPPSDYTYQQLLDQLPAYTASLQVRYPPVCKECQPAVDEEIRRSDQQARTSVLGGWLNRSKDKVGIHMTKKPSWKGRRQLLLWLLRGFLWALGFVASFAIYISGLKSSKPHDVLQPRLLPPLSLLTLLWAFWDPTWYRVHYSPHNTRQLRVEGRKTWINCHVQIWFMRFATSCMIVYDPKAFGTRWLYAFAIPWELTYLVISIWSLRVVPPPSIKLSRSSASPAPPALEEPSPLSMPADTLLSTLSLGTTQSSTANPVFGHVSLPTSIAAPSEDAEMDWTPADQTPSDKMNWLKPQRFFAPEQPTGLESLLAGASLVDPEPAPVNSTGNAGPEPYSQSWRLVMLTASCALLLSCGWMLRSLDPPAHLREFLEKLLFRLKPIDNPREALYPILHM